MHEIRKLGALAGVSLLALRPAVDTARRRPSGSGGTGLSRARRSRGDASKGTVKIAIELPQQGSEKAASDPIINGIKLAVKQAGGDGRRLQDRRSRSRPSTTTRSTARTTRRPAPTT